MVLFTDYTRQHGLVSLMGAVFCPEYVWEVSYSLDTWCGNVLNYTKSFEAAAPFLISERVSNGDRNSTFPKALKLCEQDQINLWGIWFIGALEHSSVTSKGLQDVFGVKHMFGWIVNPKCVIEHFADSGTRHSLQLVVFYIAIWEEATWQDVGCVRHYCISERVLTALKLPGPLNQDFLSLQI